jgi:hypothetical protein
LSEFQTKSRCIAGKKHCEFNLLIVVAMVSDL